MEKVIRTVESLLSFEKFDALAVGVVDFKQNKFQSFESLKIENSIQSHGKGTIYFDLASMTKPLTNSLSYFLDPRSFDEKMLQCLDHRGSLPAWGLLPKIGWKEQILSYPVSAAETLYSDFSALRVMLELQKKGFDPKKECSKIWDKETLNWLDLPAGVALLQYGYKNGQPNFGEVHDPNAWVIREFCSHAGLFSTIDGVCKTLLNYQAQTDFINKVKPVMDGHTNRFIHGWDRVENPQNTLAGVGCSNHTFGHLGFTGTSVWIDADKMIGHVILSNATKHHWFEKQGLNDIRRAVGELVWSGQF